MVAVARCNTFSLTSRVIAAYAVHAFAGVLQDDMDRHKMIEFLEEVNAMGWPTTTSIDWLSRQWHQGVRRNIDEGWN